MSITLTPYFNPKQVAGCDLWLDGADSRSFTFSSGSNISQWNDKSGNGRNTTSIVGTPILSTTTINGIQSVYFNGSSGLYGPLTNAGTTLTTFMVLTANSGIGTTARAADVGVYVPGGVTAYQQSFLTTPTQATQVLYGNYYCSSADGTIIYISVWGGPFIKSTNSGATWTAVSSLSPFMSTTVNPACSSDGTKLLVNCRGSSSGVVFTSSDSGANWTRVTISGAGVISCVAISPDGTKLVAGSGNYVYLSTNSGSTWTQSSVISASVTFVTIDTTGTRIAVATGQATMSYSTNSGTSWTSVTAAAGSSYLWTWFVGSSNGLTLVLGSQITGGSCYVSTDGGATWNIRTVGGVAYGSGSISADGTQIMFTTSSTIWFSNNSGTSFSAVTGLSNAFSWGFALVCPNKTNYIVGCGNYNGNFGSPFWTSSDRTTWTQRNISFFSGTSYITCSSNATNVLFANTSQGSEYGNGYIYRSTDGGSTWSQRTAGLGALYWSGIEMTPDGTKAYASVNGGYIYGSTDGGLSWTSLFTSMGTQSWTSISCSSDGTKVLGVNSSAIWLSTNSGSTFTSQTTTGGSNFRSGCMSTDGSKAAVCTTNGKVWVLSSGTWTQFNTNTSDSFFGISCSGDGTKLLLTASYGYAQLSSNSGSSWTTITSLGQFGAFATKISTDGTKMYLYTGKGYFSTDSGATWTLIPVGVTTSASIAGTSDLTTMYMTGLNVGTPIKAVLPVSQSDASFAMNGSTSLGFSRGASSVYSTILNTTPYVYCCKFDGTNGTLFINGVTIGASASTGAFNSSNYGVGQQLINTSAPWLGYIGEVIFYNTALIDPQRTQVEGYLAWKWGLRGSIPYYHSGSYYPYFRFTSPPLTCIPYPNAIQTYTGNYIFYTMPTTAIGLNFYMWGGGGGGGADGGFATTYSGGGAYIQGTLSVTPGEQLRIIVGQGGQTNNTIYYSTMTDAQGGGGAGTVQGGGRSAIQKFIAASWTEVVTAGGGGGSPRTNYGGNGGNAYFTGTSQAGSGQNGASGGGKGGSATAGGAGTTHWETNPAGISSSAGIQRFGGQAGGHFGYILGNAARLPGGGGGYYGGGGGWINDAGGGGGSYYNPTYVTNFIGSNGNYATPIATSAPGYITGVGVGVTAVAPGGNGLVVLAPLYRPIKKTAGQYISVTNGVTFKNGSSNVIIFSYPGGTLTVGKAIMATFLIVGGGGGGGESPSQTGGGGAGGAVYVGTPTAIATGTYSAVVGGGGAVAVNGSNSSCFGYTGQGGGKGGSWINGAGSTGGCGGGGSGEGGAGAAGTQGFGGASGRGQFTCGGGGGGMGQAGRQPDDGNPNSGGNGLQYSITGSNLYYAGGGGGGYNGASLGGLGGGGNKGVKGTDGLGGGGGGIGGAGGHGTVIISYVIS